MRRRFQGLHQADQSAVSDVPDGLFLVRVHRAQYRWHAQKPYYLLCFAVLEPQPFAGKTVTGRVYCTLRALWKLTWFLRGVVKISHTVLNGTTLLNIDGFAPASQWEELSTASSANVCNTEMA